MSSSPREAAAVQYVDIDADQEGQRIDNFLIRYLKGVPKSHIYRILRKGEVRVNKGRIKADHKLRRGDRVRIPPIRVAQQDTHAAAPREQLVDLLQRSILFENAGLLVINKPTQLAVHGGSGIRLGVIEALRYIYPDHSALELVHRLDRDTSGCLMIAKTRAALTDLQAQWRAGTVRKTYWALVEGKWPRTLRVVDRPLRKNQLASGERMVKVHGGGKPSQTEFRVLKRYNAATLVEANPVTGRTHQIRVHCQAVGHAILGDEKYSDNDSYKIWRQRGVGRLCLHARRLSFHNPITGQETVIEAEPDSAWGAIESLLQEPSQRRIDTK